MISLIISTYNNPTYLIYSLESAARQSVLPDEVIIADDGSTDSTRIVIQEFSSRAPFPVIHIWHPDQGFRLAKIRNEAAVESRGGYIIQIDGDIIMGRHFIEDHITMSRPNTILYGSRTILSEQFSLNNDLTNLNFLTVNRLGNRNIMNSLRCITVAKLMADTYKNNYSIYDGRGCNMSFYKEDFFAVGGYDENFEGWGLEDTDLNLRFYNYGCKKRMLKFAAVAFHLYHKEVERASNADSPNLRILNQHITGHTTFIKNGTAKYLSKRTVLEYTKTVYDGVKTNKKSK